MKVTKDLLKTKKLEHLSIYIDKFTHLYNSIWWKMKVEYLYMGE